MTKAEGARTAARIEEEVGDFLDTRAWLAAIVDSSDDAIISKGLDGRITSWNPAAQRLFGYTADEMIGQLMLRIIPPDMQGEEAEILAKIRAGEKIDHYETIRVRKDGTPIHVSITVSPVRNKLGIVTGASKIARDITEQREEQKRKDEFLAVLAHELRNPLAPILTAMAIFRNEAAQDVQKRSAGRIVERQVQKMVRLLDDLLDVSRIARGRVDLKKARVDVRALVTDAVETARPVIDSKGHSLRLVVPDEALWIDADPARISQILGNLLTNAAKYTNPGGHIELEAVPAGSEVVITVTDNGIGIGPETMPILFNRFAQAPGTIARSEGGLGIGLSLVREFVLQHGGSVEAQSEGEGHGSRFVVRLPRLEEAEKNS
jgi:two-component system CheB/CheR fusion protein